MQLQTSAVCVTAVMASTGIIKFRMTASYFKLRITKAERNIHKHEEEADIRSQRQHKPAIKQIKNVVTVIHMVMTLGLESINTPSCNVFKWVKLLNE